MKPGNMKSAMGKIRTLVVILLIKVVGAQEEFSNQDLLRLQQYAVNNGQVETVSNYNTNILQRDPKGSVDVQFHLPDDSNNNGDYSKSDRGRSRKVYRIKNPFQQQSEDEKASQDSNTSYDSATGASNQYPAIQYSLPPEEFLQQMRENQYHQQLQFSTPAPSYTATPQPSFQYTTLSPNFDNNQQINQISSIEPKAYTPTYQPNLNSFQYNPNTYSMNGQRSTPLSPYLSTPSSQYLVTSGNNYVSTSLPYVSSQPSLQQYVSSPLSNIQSGTFDYSSNRVTTLGSNVNNYDINDQNNRMQIDHYDNSANGIRYPLHIQNQNDYPSSTVSPSSTQYSDSLRESWQNAMNALSKSEQSYSPAQYQNYRYNSNQQGTRQEINTDNANSDTHRIGNIASANNLYFNYAQPDYQPISARERSRDSEQETIQSEAYSHGDYGWKLSDRKNSFGLEVSTNPNSYFKYQIHSMQPETGVVSQVNFQMDSSKPYNYDQNAKPVSEKLETDEFVKAAAKIHENYKQQMEANKYSSNINYNTNNNNNNIQNSPSYYNYNDKHKAKLYSDYNNSFGNLQSELITANPFYYLNQRVQMDAKSKQPFDHDKALKNIVPIDVSNVVPNSDSPVKGNSELDTTNRYNILGYNKDLTDSRQTSDSYYKDKQSIYGLNFKIKPEDLTDADKLRQIEQSGTYFGKSHISDAFYKHGINSGSKRYVDEMSQSLNLGNQLSNNHHDNAQISSHLQQGLHQRPQVSSDISSILKLNDLPYRLTQGFNSDTLRLHNGNYGNLPTPLPMQINQNVEHHNLDVAQEILNKLMGSKRNSPTININRPDIDAQTGNLISTINGFKVANPFNVDLKLVADILKGKPGIDNSQMSSLRGDYNKSPPMKVDVSQLQQFLQLKNENNAMSLNNGVGSLSNSYFDIFNNERFPYQGVKYSRSEEEPENIPLTDSSNNHPIGAVIEESVNEQDVPEIPEPAEESLSTSIDEDISKDTYTSNPRFLARRQKPGSGYSSRYIYKRKYPKTETDEPYPLLKPPPPRMSRHRGFPKDKISNRRRLNRPKMLRILKTEPLFEAGSSIEDEPIKPSTHIKFSFAEDKIDVSNEEENT